MCKFCEALEFFGKTDKAWGTTDFKYEYTVAIVTHFYRKGDKAHASRTTDYRNKGIGYRLNYCPECGRDLRKRPARGCRRARGQICHCWDGFECTRSEVVQENEERCPCDEEARNVSES